MHCNGVILHK